ncbi:MAG TPA: hypothetical protein VHY76_06575 [Acetobacteraceae bacterium]|nr:hypothetical protein [Acetobacteraceae bacterium]
MIGSRDPSAGILFAEDFDAVVRLPAPEPEVIEPVFSHADLIDAREAARAEGRAEAEAVARMGAAQQRTTLLARLADALGAAGAQAAASLEGHAEETARLLLACLCQALPALCADHGAAELRAVARALLPTLRTEPRVTIRAHPHHVPDLQRELDALDPPLAGTAVLEPVQTMARGDVRVHWQCGRAERSAAAIRAALEAALAPLGLLAEAPLGAGVQTAMEMDHVG